MDLGATAVLGNPLPRIRNYRVRFYDTIPNAIARFDRCTPLLRDVFPAEDPPYTRVRNPHHESDKRETHPHGKI
jgi:hypothetical protein